MMVILVQDLVVSDCCYQPWAAKRLQGHVPYTTNTKTKAVEQTMLLHTI